MTESREDGCALVTGASKGIGAAIAKALASDGWGVGVNYNSDQAGAEAVVSAIEDDGGRALAVGGDVADPAVPDQLFGALEEHFGCPVLVLVNNAGITRDDLTPSLDDAAWDAVIQTDLSAAFRLTRRALRPMMRARQGRIVNVSSVVGLRANPGQANYCGGQGRADRAHQDLGRGGGAARHHDQRRRPRADRDRHDGRGLRRPGGSHPGAPRGDAGGGRRLRALSHVRRGELCHRCGAIRGRRPGRMTLNND